MKVECHIEGMILIPETDADREILQFWRQRAPRWLGRPNPQSDKYIIGFEEEARTRGAHAEVDY